MTTINLFPIPIKRVSIVPTQEEYNALDAYLNSVFDQSGENVWALETGKSTGEHDLYLYERPEIQWLIQPMFEQARTFWHELDYRHGAKITITSAWANLHTTGQVTGEHSHCGGSFKSHLSAAYYFKKPPCSGNIMFTDPLEYIHKMSPVHQYDETNGKMYQEIQADQFDLLLFPSWLKHQTKPNNSSEDRIAISVNFVGLY